MANVTPPRNAVTELPSTPFLPKTSSVPFDGRIFKASTLDADLATELSDATISEQAQGTKDNYIAYWCNLSDLEGNGGVRAEGLKTVDDTPLFLDSSWNPILIPHLLRESTTRLIKDTSVFSALGSNPSSNPSSSQSTPVPSTGTVQPKSKSKRQPKKPAITPKRRSKPSLRRELLTRNIPDTDLQETVEVTLLPLVGSEEFDVSTWLNRIITSLSLLVPQSNGSSQSSPEGWNGPRLTRSAAAAAAGGDGKTYNQLRLWSSQYAAKRVENSPIYIKPDIVFCGQLDQQTGFAWRNVISFLELTSLTHSAQLRRDMTRKAYAVFMSQPSRRFVVALSLARQEFRLHVFDRSGTIHTLGYNLHKSADLFVRIIHTLAFGSPWALGFDPTFVDPSLSPSVLFRPRSDTAVKKSRVIYIRDTPYTVVRPIYISHLIRGRATSSWLVKRGQKSFVVKDCWTHSGRKRMEEDILIKIDGLVGVPHLVEAWTVQTKGADETTDLLRPSFLVKNINFETRIHRRLLLTPVGEPLVQFSCLQELVSILIDIVHIHFVLVHKHGILHRDISINNILTFICNVRWSATSDDEKEREDVIASKGFRRGYLIDFDYSERINSGEQGVSSGHRTGTIPFMAVDILEQYNKPTKGFTHTFAHDLESIVYVLVWVCIIYQGPNEVRTDRSIEDTCIKLWSQAKTPNDILCLCDQKMGQLGSRSMFVDFTPYFKPLQPTITRLYKLIIRSREPDDEYVLTHAAVTEVLMDAFKAVKETSCFVANTKRTWERTQNEPTPTQATYNSEGRRYPRRKVMKRNA